MFGNICNFTVLLQDAAQSVRPPGAEKIQKTLAAVLDEPEFKRSLWDKSVGELLKWFWELFKHALSPLRDLEGAGRILVLAALSILLVLLVGHLAWTLLSALRAAVKKESVPLFDNYKKEETLRELAAGAGAAVAEGDYLKAMRAYFIACVVLLNKRGEIHVLPGYTHEEILQKGGATEHDRARLAPLIVRLDQTWFGGAAATRDDAAMFASAFQHFRREEQL
ncbi:MAG: hypothetical protein ACKVS6_05385 [Planctomycetota bacterium]